MKKMNLITLLTTAVPITLVTVAALTSASGAVTVNASGPVPVTIADDGNWNPIAWGTKSVSSSGLVTSISQGYNQGSYWGNHMLDFNNHLVIEMEISYNAYDSETSNIGGNSDGLDIYISSSDLNTDYAIFRIWSASGGIDNGSHSTQISKGDWSNTTSDFVNNHGGDTMSWIKGDAKSTSSFKLRFSSDLGIEFWNAWGDDNWSRLGETTAAQAVLDSIKNGFSSGTFGLKFGADGGFTRDCSVTLKSYCGQSFANDGKNFTDNTAPELIFDDTDIYSVDIYEEVNLKNIVGSYYDLFGGTVTNTYKDGDTVITSGKYTFNTIGEKTLTITAEDARSNSVTKNINFSVINYNALSFYRYMEDASSTPGRECHDMYADAKKRAITMDEENKTIFQTEKTYADMCEEYVRWCTKNGDPNPFSGDPVSDKGGIVTNNSETVAIIAFSILAVTLAATAVAFAVIQKKRKETK